jgi:hypothetical protein
LLACERCPDKEGNHDEHLYRALWGTTYALMESEGLLAMGTQTSSRCNRTRALSILQHFELLEEYHDNGLAGARR